MDSCGPSIRWGLDLRGKGHGTRLDMPGSRHNRVTHKGQHAAMRYARHPPLLWSIDILLIVQTSVYSYTLFPILFTP